MKKSAACRPLRITFRVPKAFAEKLRRLVSAAGYGEREIHQFARECFVDDCTLDAGNWLGTYVYPNRRAAECVAARLLKRKRWHGTLFSCNTHFGGLPYATGEGVRYLRVNVPTPDWATDREAVAAGR